MENTPQNKQIGNEDFKQPRKVLTTFHFPQQQVNIEAETLEEAQAKLKELLTKDETK